MGWLEGWPPQALVALATLFISNLVLAGSFIWKLMQSSSATNAEMHKLGWQEAQRQSELVDTLRQVLDRGRRRENAYSTGFELLLIALPPEPSPDQVQIISRARSVFESALICAPTSRGKAES